MRKDTYLHKINSESILTPNVGIGTSIPSNTLEVAGNGVVISTTNQGDTNDLPALQIKNTPPSAFGGIVSLEIYRNVPYTGINNDISTISSFTNDNYANKREYSRIQTTLFNTALPSGRMRFSVAQNGGLTSFLTLDGKNDQVTVSRPLNVNNYIRNSSSNFTFQTIEGYSFQSYDFSIQPPAYKERIRILNTGEFGIGVASPSFKLDVDGDINCTGAFRINGLTLNNAEALWFSNANGIYSHNKVSIATTEPTCQLDINSNIIRLRIPNSPLTSSSTGHQGDLCWDENYMYICVATNTWKRVALTSW